MNYNGEDGFSTDKDQQVSITTKKIESKESDIKLEGEIFLKPQVVARLYRVAGPYGYMKPYLRGEFEWPSPYKKDDLYFGVSGGVGIKVSEPIFMKTIVNYQSGEIFNFNTSFDLIKTGEDALDEKSLDIEVKSEIKIDRIGPEGFVVLSVKQSDENEYFRYELLKPTKTGVLVPSELFYMDGKLSYYPLPESKKENFTVRIYGKDKSFEDVEITLVVTNDVQEEVSQDRYGITTNSYRVASGSRNDYDEQVPRHRAGNEQSSLENIRQCLMADLSAHRAARGDDHNSNYQRCSSLTRLQQQYSDFLYGKRSQNNSQQNGDEENHNDNMSRPAFSNFNNASKELTELKIHYANQASSEFSVDFLNLSQWADFALSRRNGQLNCKRELRISTVETEKTLGLKFESIGCPGIVRPIPIDTRYITKILMGNANIQWNATQDSNTENSIISQVTFSKFRIQGEQQEFSYQGEFSILMPMGFQSEQYIVTGENNLHRYYKEELLPEFHMGRLQNDVYSGKMIKVQMNLEKNSESDKIIMSIQPKIEMFKPVSSKQNSNERVASDNQQHINI